MSLIELRVIDWLILFGYLILVLCIGWVASRRVKSTQNYFLGGRRFGKVTMVAQSFGTGTHAEMPVSLSGIVYSMGLSGIWFQWKNLFVTPFYWLLAPLFRRFRRTTTAEVVEDRYGPWMGVIYTVFALGFFAINLASMLKGAAKVIDISTGGGLPVDGIVIAMTTVFILYSFMGGLVATAWADVFQGFLILTLSFLVIPLAWGTVGGLTGIRETVGAAKMTLLAPEGIGFWFVAVLTVNGLIGIIAQPHMIAAVGTGKDEYACRIGQFYGNFVKRICTVGWAIVGLITATVVLRGTFGPNPLSDPEEAFGFACRQFLFPGGVGLLIACFLASNMAGCSAFMINSGALFTNSIYRRHFRPSATDRHYLWMGRFSGVAITLAAVIYAVFFIERVLYSFLLTETLATFMGVSIFGGIIWRRANRWGALASILVAFSVNFACYLARGQRLDRWDPTVFSIALLTGIAALVIVSLLTREEPAQKMEQFYRNLDTPSMGSGEHPAEKATDAETAQRERLIIVDILNLKANSRAQGFWKTYRTDLKGFLVGAALVALLVIATWALTLLA